VELPAARGAYFFSELSLHVTNKSPGLDRSILQGIIIIAQGIRAIRQFDGWQEEGISPNRKPKIAEKQKATRAPRKYDVEIGVASNGRVS
jgi:hypothetical protein